MCVYIGTHSHECQLACVSSSMCVCVRVCVYVCVWVRVCVWVYVAYKEMDMDMEFDFKHLDPTVGTIVSSHYEKWLKIEE